MQAPLVPFLLAGAGAGLNAAAERNAAKERRGILNRAMERNDQDQDRATQQALAEGQKIGGQQRLEAMQQVEQSAIAQALKDVGGTDQGAGAAIIDTAGGEGAVSGDFIKAKAARAQEEGERLTAVARELAKVRAPGQLVGDEGLRRADLTERLGSMRADSRARTQAAALDAEGVEAPWWGQVGKLAGNAAALYAANTPAGAAGPSPYALSGQGTRLGESSTGFWSSGSKDPRLGAPASRIRFGG